MPVASTTQRNDYTGDDATGTYAYGFHIIAQADLVVEVRDTSQVEVTLVITTDYTVTGVDVVAGGNVVLVEAGQAFLDGSGNLKNNFRLTIRRVRALTQATDIRNQGPFFPETHELEFDDLVKIIQDLQEQLTRCIKIPSTISPAEFDTELPATLLDVTAVKAIQIKSTADGVQIEA